MTGTRLGSIAIRASVMAALVMAASGVIRESESSQSTGGSARLPRNEAEFDQMFKDVSNWGRWGQDDQRGATNLVTAAKRRQAASLVKSGVTISLAQSPLPEKAVDNSSPWELSMNPLRPEAPPGPTRETSDTLKINYHGWVHSHIDALCHMSYKGKAFNGYDAKEFATPKGCVKLGIENQKDGVFTRGILIDIPRLKGIAYLEPGTPVFAEDIEAWEKKAGVRIGSGDAVLLRTGRWVRRAKLGPWDPWKVGMPGYHASAIPWFKNRDVAFIGSDAVQEVIPSRVEGMDRPIHVLAIVALGVPLFDDFNLDELAETAARLNRWEFLLTVSPLPLGGGTGSPVNAQATF